MRTTPDEKSREERYGGEEKRLEKQRYKKVTQPHEKVRF